MSFVQKLVSIALTFFGRQIFLQVLSIEYLGINGLFTDILSMLSLADLGLAVAMSFSFYKPLAEKDEDKLAALIGFYRRIYNGIAIFIAVAGLALTPFVRLIVNLENDIPYLEAYYLIAVANTVISYLFVYKATIITADQNSSIVSKYSVWTSILKLMAQIAVLLATGSFMLYCLVTVLGTIGYNLLISRKAGMMYPFIKRKARLGAGDKREIFHNIKSMFIYKLATVIFNATDNIFISALIGTAIVGQYENYRLAVMNLSVIAFMFFTALSPSIGNLIAKESPEKRLRVFRITQTATFWIGGFFGFCLFFLLDDFVALWLGSGFVFDALTKTAILLSFYMSLTLFPIIAFREATGLYQKTKYVMIGAALLKIALSIVLGMYWGLAGIVLSSPIAKLVTYAWYEPRLLFRDFLGGKARGYLPGHIINFFMLCGLVAVVHYFLPWGESAGWLSWLLKAAAYTLGINAVYYLRFFKTQEFRDITGIITGLLKNRKGE